MTPDKPKNTLIIKNIETKWVCIAEPYKRKPEDKGEYMVTLVPNAVQVKEIETFLRDIWEYDKGVKRKPEWFGSRKVEENQVFFTAKKPAFNKKSEEVYLSVYSMKKGKDGKPVQYDQCEIPKRISHGAIMNVSVFAKITEYGGQAGVSMWLNSVQLVKFENFETNEFTDTVDEIEDIVNDDMLF